MPETSEPSLADVRRWIGSLAPFASRPHADWRVSRLASLTNHAFLVEGDGAAFVLRVPAEEGALSIDRRAEFHNLTIASGLGLAPPLRHLDAGSGVLVSEYLSGSRALDEADFGNPLVQEKVARALARLRTSGATFQGRQDPQAAIDRYLAIHADREAIDLRRAIGPALAALRNSAPPLVPAHVDPHPGNFLLKRDGELALIDWEFSAMADPHWDAAAVLNSMPPERAVTERLATVALGNAGPATIARLRVFQAALSLVAGSWAAMEAAARNDPGLARLAAASFGKCRAEIEHGWLAASLAGMAEGAP